MAAKSSHLTIAPVEHSFKTRGYVPGGIISNCKQELLDIEVLPPFLRLLLVTDGTVTKSLEAYFWEQVAVENLGQFQTELAEPMAWLGMEAGALALQREVRLKGSQSGNVYAYAKSILKMDLLPEQLREDLITGKIGIGEMLRERGLESYREILDMGREIDPSLDPVFNVERRGELVYRTYRVIIDHRPTMLITEKFPYRFYYDR